MQVNNAFFYQFLTQSSHVICKKCFDTINIKLSKKCPFCSRLSISYKNKKKKKNDGSVPGKLFHVEDLVLSKYIKSMTVQCKFSNYGCGKILALKGDEVHKHQSNCYHDIKYFLEQLSNSLVYSKDGTSRFSFKYDESYDADLRHLSEHNPLLL